MHMSDGLLSAPVGLTFLCISGLAVGLAAARFSRQEPDSGDLPLTGVMAAFVFAAQMVNVTIPGTGSSGHIAGSTLLAVLLGPVRALICIAAVLIVQALFFADGGLMALGCNFFNMGMVGALGGWAIYYALAGGKPEPTRRFWAAGAAAWCAVVAGAAMVAVQTFLSGRTDIPLVPFLSGMVIIHMAIGILEGVITAGVVIFLLQNRPNLFAPTPGTAGTRPRSPALLVGLGILTLVVGGGISLLASTLPDGLEYTLEMFSGGQEKSGDLHRLAGKIQETTAIFPDYEFSLSGIIGAGLAFLAVGGGLWLVIMTKNKRRESDA